LESLTAMRHRAVIIERCGLRCGRFEDRAESGAVAWLKPLIGVGETTGAAHRRRQPPALRGRAGANAAVARQKAV
jgi:hypothetical protein